MSFNDLKLSKHLLKSIKYAGYETPTGVQLQAIPLILAGRDVIVQARTGTGKTAGYALPILNRLEDDFHHRNKSIQALVLAPTRELAMQIHTSFKTYGRSLSQPPKLALIVGGANINVQMRGLGHGVDIVVATPGRLLDVMSKQTVDLTHLKFTVIDEADKMFALGFADEMQRVLDALPESRQNILCSATMDEHVSELSRRFVKNAEHIEMADSTTPIERITQRVIEVNPTNRGPLLRHLIRTNHWKRVLVFVAKARDADIMVSKLNKAGIESEAFHAGLTQPQRVQVLQDFKDEYFDVLVATDLAARGIDIPQLGYVVNYDLPRAAADYIHRIGRTARAGESGVAITFIGHADQDHFKLIEKRARISLPRESIEGYELTGEPMPKVKGKAPVKGKRMSKKDKARLAAKNK